MESRESYWVRVQSLSLDHNQPQGRGQPENRMNIELSKIEEGIYQAVVCFPWGQSVACIGQTAGDAVMLAADRIVRAENANLDLSRALGSN